MIVAYVVFRKADRLVFEEPIGGLADQSVVRLMALTLPPTKAASEDVKFDKSAEAVFAEAFFGKPYVNMFWGYVGVVDASDE